VFFKTSNSSLNKSGQFHKDFVYLEPDAANELVKHKIRIVGIDYLSVDPYASDLPAHKILLSNNVLIVENLNLTSIAQGIYRVFIVPLNIPNMDGLPVRVFAFNDFSLL
jgi:arylformamidase